MKFCTKLDHFYLDRGIALYSSVRKQHPGAEIHVLALSREAADFLESKSLPGLHVIRLETLIASEPRLASVRPTRTDAEFAFTLTPFIVCEALKHCPGNEWVLYVDADMLFFGPVGEVLKNHQAADVLMSPHNFSDHMREQQRFGLFNTGFTAFRKSANGEKCVKWWASKCIEWCFDRLENGNFADQKYIEQFAKVVSSAVVLDHPGINCAPWNASGKRFSCESGQVLVDARPLLLYHFAKVKRIAPWCIATRTQLQGVIGAKGLNRFVYRPYAQALESAAHHYEIPPEWIFKRSNPRHGAKYRGFEKDENPSRAAILTRIARGEYVTAKPPDVFKVLGWQPNIREANYQTGDEARASRPQLQLLKVSIVTPSLNQGRWLASALSSVVGQQYSNLQHVVMDGGSTDGSLKIIEEHSKNLHAYRSGTDRGQYDAINQGFMQTSAEIMGWLNSDDLHFPWTLSTVSEIFSAFPQIRWLTTCFPIVVDGRGMPIRCAEVNAYSRRGVLHGETLPGSQGFTLHGIQQESTFWRRDLWEQIGASIDIRYRLAADYDLWIRFAKKAELYSVAVPLSAFRRHGNQKTSRDMDRYKSEALESFKHHGWGFSNRRLRTFARTFVPDSFKPLAARLGLLYPAKIVRKHKDTGQWVIREIFA